MTFTLPIEYEGKTGTATILRLFDGYRRPVPPDDVVSQNFRYLLHTPRDEFVPLGDFGNELAGDRAHSRILNLLGIDPSRSGGHGNTKTAGLYDRSVRLQSRKRYCIHYRMNYPFTGTALDCGEPIPKAQVGYANSFVTWTRAIELACELARSDTGVGCGYSGYDMLFNMIWRTEGDALNYVVALGQLIECHPGRGGCTDHIWKFRVSQVRAGDGHTTLLSAGGEEPNFRHWLMRKPNQPMERTENPGRSSLR